MKAYQQSLKYYTELESHYPKFEGIHESRYYAGQSHYLLENYRMVLIINEQISKKSEFYPYGMYTVALANLKKKNVKQSIENLTFISEFSSRRHNVNQIIDSARLTLGYIYFELAIYPTALKYLFDISANFVDYPDALLAIAWNTIKLKNYNLALKVLNYLILNYPGYDSLIEAHFLRGHCYLKLGSYDSAVKEYDEIINYSQDSNEYVELLNQMNQELKEQEKRLEELSAELLETRLEKLNFKLFALESRISNKSGNGSSNYEKEPIEKRREKQEELFKKIAEEKRDFENNLTSIASINKQLETNQLQKKWKNYARYSKVRALCLKELATQ